MAEKPTTETDAAENVEGTEKDSETEPSTTTEGAEKGSTGGEDDSNVTPREKELRRLLRENEKELNRLRKAEDARRTAELSETEILKETNAGLSQELEGLRRKAIATEFGLSPELAERLRGVTEEELRADAASLSSLVKPPKPKSSDVGIGAPGADGEAPADPVKAHRAAMAGRRF